MKKTITNLSFRFQHPTKGVPLAIFSILIAIFGSITASAQSPYCSVSHINTTPCATYGMYIGTVTVSQGATTLYTKTDACNSASPPHYALISSSSAFTLTGGGIYNFSATSNGTNAISLGVWIDLNGDNDFDDTDEFIDGIAMNASGNFDFTLPCTVTSGASRMRVRARYNGFGLWNSSQSCSNVTYGETEDFNITLATSSGLSSDFYKPDSAFIGTPVTFVNSNQFGYISHNWTINGTSYSTTNATHVFSAAGNYDVKLVSANCLGVDSTSKTVRIVAPTAPPVANFVSDKNVVELFESPRLIDLSSNGPTYWSWMLTNGTDTIDGDDQPQLRGGNYLINKNPSVFTGNYPGAVPEGVWDVCLKATNIVGASAEFCRTGYITVRRSSFNIGAGTSFSVITSGSGTIYDGGGPNNDYPGATNQQATIAPCGAQSVTLEFSTFKLLANADLKIFDGVNALGTPLHSGSGFTLGNEPSGPITANSGAMYLLWNSTASPTDSGFAATWTSVAGTGAAPVAGFTMNGATLYNSVYTDFINTSLNAEGSTTFEWTITGPAGSNTYYTRDLANQIFTTNGAYTATLVVTSCDGTTSTSTQNFTVAPANTPTNLDFTSSNQRPAVGDAVTFTATSDKANTWEWSFFPPTSVTASLPSPANDNLKERTFTFAAPGSYTVQLTGYNSITPSLSEATVVKTAHIIVVQHCIPVISVTTSTDVGISYVSLEDTLSNFKFENSSSTGVAYTDFSSLGTIDLKFGGNYEFVVKRSSNVNPMTRKIWVDWNVDGTFDASEVVAEETTPGTSISWTGTINVPDASSAFEANTRLRIGVSFDNDPNEPCGANSNSAANRVGEFEDYAIRVVNDGDLPIITLIDADTIYIEQTATPNYTRTAMTGATANDPSQGDVSANLTMSTDVDQTLPGIYYEVYNASDASGNAAAKVTRVVYVVSDQTAPVISIIGSADTTIEVGTVWVDLGATANDNKEGDITSAIVTSGAVDYNILGSYDITYSIQDNQGNASSAIRTVRVVDTQNPVIENAIADKSNPLEWNVDVQLQNIFADVTSASDNYNTLADNLVFTANPASAQGGASVDTRFQGTTTVTYTATDESGNLATQIVNYVVKDYIPPVINLRTLDVIDHPVNTPYTPVAATATDNLYSSTQISLTAASNVDAYTLGTYQDTYTATDAAGNVSTAVRTVNVVDNISPTISGKKGAIVRVGVGSTVNIVDYINFADNYDAPSVLRDNHTLLFSDVNLHEAGLYSVVFKTEDNSGNVSKDYTIIVDVQYKWEVVTNGINDLSIDDLLTISPNPTNGKLNINVNLPENEEINIAVFNTMGQQVALVKNGKVDNGTYAINLQDNVNGIYYVKMNLNGNIITKKVVLNE